MSILPKESRRGEEINMEGRALSRPINLGRHGGRPSKNLAGDRVSSTNAGKHFPKRIENVIH